jgi:soluble lytic murein transglycosylase-like protein
LSVLCGIFVGSANAEIYVHKDSQGVLNFSNVPPFGSQPSVREASNGIGVQSPARSRFEDIIRAASDRYGVDHYLIAAVIKVESDFNPQARSQKGAQGLMQLMPDTARLYSVSNVYDPEENIDAGVRHLKLLLNRYESDLPLTLAAYNAGIKAVERYGGIPPFAETKEYLRRVLRLMLRVE